MVKHTLTGHNTPLPSLHICRDYTFLVIGVPVTAASRAIATNNFIVVSDKWEILDKITPSRGQEGY